LFFLFDSPFLPKFFNGFFAKKNRVTLLFGDKYVVKIVSKHIVLYVGTWFGLMMDGVLENESTLKEERHPFSNWVVGCRWKPEGLIFIRKLIGTKVPFKESWVRVLNLLWRKSLLMWGVIHLLEKVLCTFNKTFLESDAVELLVRGKKHKILE
jgi:hypothetical protein